MAHRFDHLTLNPSPEGEGLYSIALAMVAFRVSVGVNSTEWDFQLPRTDLYARSQILLEMLTFGT